MCGICGQFNPEGINERALRAMTDALGHRGPDDDGQHVQGPVGLGHRRLSIIDLAKGQQPISTADGSITIVFNGEIYNYQQLRPALVERGYPFKTDSDTEVLLALYQQHDTDCLKYLRGMFAFAIYDHRKNRLFAARDHLGQKPLFYSQQAGQFLFASEIKSILAADPDLATIDLAALDQYLTLRVIAPPRTMFASIRKLPPAHYLTFDESHGLQINRYWQLSYQPKIDATDDELVDLAEQQILESLKLHLIADVPVGAFVSGGLDSTLLAAMVMHHRLTDQPLQTFSVSLPYGNYDEAPFAKLVADKYGTNHRQQTIHPSLIKTLPELVYHLDEPSDPLAVCQYLISEMASKHVKVVIGGEGGDELFGGYDRYYGNRYTDYYSWIPHPIRKYALGPALSLVPDGRWYKSKAHQLKWLHHLSFHSAGTRYAKSLGYFYFTDAIRLGLYGPTMLDAAQHFDPDAAIRDPFDNAPADDPIDRMLYADAQVRLPDHPVMILDRMTMAHGLEARAPFMDHKLAEFAARLPIRMKVRGRTTRFIQRQLAKRYLPPELLCRPKQGFQSALPYMLRQEYHLLFNLFLSASQLAADGILNQPAVNTIVHQHLAGKVDHGNRLWLLLNSEVWYRMHIQRQSPSHIAEQIQSAAATPAAASA